MSFDLERALKGEPLKTRDGDKAYILHHTKKPLISTYALIGYVSAGKFGNGDDIECPKFWDIYGRIAGDEGECPSDIVGMWNEDHGDLACTEK